MRLFTLRVRDWVAMLRKTRPQTAPRTRFLRSFHRFWVVMLRKITGFSAVILGGDAPNYLGGNPAGVVLLDGDTFPAEELMLQIAAELRYSETAFVKRDSDSEYTVC